MDAFLFETRRWIAEQEASGHLDALPPGEREDLAIDLARRLEERFQAEVGQELSLRGKGGKAAEWERMLAYGGQYLYIWLGLNMPGLREFRREVFARARAAFRARPFDEHGSRARPP